MKKAWIIITAWIIVAATVVLLCRRIPATVPYSELEGIEFWNAGTGNWQEYVNVMSDGTFTAGGHDLDMGVNGEGYPGGTMWMTEGGGTLSDFKKIDDYTYKANVKSTYSNIYETETNGNLRFVYDDIFIKEGDIIYIYLPGTPTQEIPKDYFDSVSVKLGYKWPYEHVKTDFYAMYIVTEDDDYQMGFVGYK